MDNSSNDKLTNIENLDEEKKSLSSSMGALPTRRAARSISRQSEVSTDVKKQDNESIEKPKEEPKVKLKEEQKEEQKNEQIEESQVEQREVIYIKDYLEDKEDSIDEDTKDVNEQSNDNLKNKIISSINNIEVPKKVISNIKHVTKNNKIGVTSIGIAILIVVLVVMIFLVFSKDEKDNSMAKYLDNMRSQEVVQCEIEQVNYFFQTYYDALASGNTTIIEGLFDDPSKANISAEISKIVESFANIKVYITNGINENEIVAFVYNELKFPNINTTAPCVDSFYLKYNESDNSLKIVTDMYTDAKIIKFMNVVAKKEPVRSLIFSTNENLNTALESDSKLKDLYLIMQSMTNNAEDTTEAP